MGVAGFLDAPEGERGAGSRAGRKRGRRGREGKGRLVKGSLGGAGEGGMVIKIPTVLCIPHLHFVSTERSPQIKLCSLGEGSTHHMVRISSA